jgi:hypothetical protein
MDTQTETLHVHKLNKGDTWTIHALVPHQLESMSENASISEIGTSVTAEDIYKILTETI